MGWDLKKRSEGGGLGEEFLGHKKAQKDTKSMRGKQSRRSEGGGRLPAGRALPGPKASGGGPPLLEVWRVRFVSLDSRRGGSGYSSIRPDRRRTVGVPEKGSFRNSLSLGA